MAWIERERESERDRETERERENKSFISTHLSIDGIPIKNRLYIGFDTHKMGPHS
jgi:hypothetical protein